MRARELMVPGTSREVVLHLHGVAPVPNVILYTTAVLTLSKYVLLPSFSGLIGNSS